MNSQAARLCVCSFSCSIRTAILVHSITRAQAIWAAFREREGTSNSCTVTRNFRYAQAGCLVRHDQQNIKTNDKSHYFAPSPFNSHKKIPQVHETN